MTSEERAQYSYYQKRLYNDRDELEAAEARDEAKLVKMMLKNGVSMEEIAHITELSVTKIEALLKIE